MLTEASDYETLYRNFRWEIPARFNIATACCDRHADGSGRLALIYVDEDGAATRTSFDEVAEKSRRFANVLKPTASCAATASRCFCRSRWNCRSRIWRRFDPAWCRSRYSRCSARTRWNFVCRIPAPRRSSPTQAGWEKLAKIRDRLPDLQNIYVIGDGAPAGAKSFWSAIAAGIA